MSQKAIEGLVGPIWVLCGLVMALSPPLNLDSGPSYRGLGQYSQLLGVLIALAGAWNSVRELRDLKRAPASARPRISWTPRHRLVVGAALLVGVSLAGLAVWQAVMMRNPALVAFVIFVLTLCAILAPRALAGVRD